MDFGVDHLRALRVVIALETVAPGLMVGRFHQLQYAGHGVLAVSQYGNVDGNILVDFRGVDVEVNLLGLTGISADVTRNAVVESHADGHEQVALLRLDVRGQAAVHAEHAHIERVGRGQARKAEQGAAGRHVGLLDELAHFFLSVAEFHALSDQHKRLLSGVDKLGGSLNAARFGFGHGFVATQETDFLRNVFGLFDLGILGEVEHHGAGASGAGNVESTFDGRSNVFGATYLISPFADGVGHIDDVALLESIRTQHLGAYLSCNDDNRCAVEHGVSNTCYRIGGSGTAGYEAHSHLSAHSGITFCCVDGTLFVANQNVVQPVSVIVECVIYWHDSAAGIAKQRVYAFGNQALHEYFRTG